VEDDPRDDGSDPGFRERIVTENNATEEKVPEKGMRMTHKMYSFNAYEMGVSWEDGKLVYDDTQYDNGTTSFENRIDNAIGLMRLWGMSPKTLTEEQYKQLEKAIADIHNVIESTNKERGGNAVIIEYLKNILGLKDGEYNIIYAIKNTVGEQKKN
jgi:hypothetical protein